MEIEKWIIVYLTGVIASMLLLWWMFSDDLKSGARITAAWLIVAAELSILSWLNVLACVAIAMIGISKEKSGK